MSDAPTSEHHFHPKDLLLPLVGALWACANLIYTVTSKLNEVRDVIVTGHLGGATLTLAHREHIYANDWWPYTLMVVCVCFGFSAFAAWTPRLLSNLPLHQRARPIAYCVAVAAALTAVCWLPSAYNDWRFIRVTLDAAQHAPPQSPPPDAPQPNG